MGRSSSIWRWVAGALLVILAPLAACTRQPHDDLEHYVHVDLVRVAGLESRLNDGTGGKRGLAPVAARYVRELEAIAPATPEVRALHRLKLAAARTQAEALALFEQALTRGDRSLGNAARVRFKAARVKRRMFEKRLLQLERENGVKPEP